MKFDELLGSIKILSVVSLIALVGTSLVIYNAYAQEENVGVKGDASVKINPNKSEIGTDASASANVTAKSNEDKSDDKSQDKSSEYIQSSSETESHEHYAMSYEKMSANEDETMTVQTEKHLYKPGDQVSIEGSFWSGLVSTVGGISTVSIQVTDNSGAVVYAGKGQVNADGDYSANFQLPSDAKNGAYKVDIKADVNSDVLNSLPLKMQAGIESSTKFVVISPNAWAVKAEGKDFQVQIASNSSSVTNLNFDGQNKKLSFTVQGETGTRGVTQVTIPKSMLSGDLSVMIDGQAMSQADVVETADTSDSTTLELNYHHSTHTIDIVGTSAVPEFPIASIILAASIGSMVLLFSIKPKIVGLHSKI